MDKKIIKILLIVIGIIGVGSILIAIIGYITPDTIVKIPGLPRDEGIRLITTEESSPGFQTVENKFDGYQITVLSNWFVGDLATLSGGLKIFYDVGVTEAPLDFYSGLLLTIFTLENPRDVETYIPADAEFNEIEINGERAFISRYKALEEVGTDENFNDILEVIEDSQVTGYIFRGGGKTYLVTCTVIATNFLELATLCEEQVQTFTIAN